MEKTKRTKVLFGTLAPIVGILGVAPVLLSAGCKRLPDNVKSNRFVYEYNSPYTPKEFDEDASRSYGSFLETSTWQFTHSTFLSKTGLNAANINAKKQILEPTFWKYRLELAKEVILTLKNGTTKVYDNDNAEVRPAADKSDGTYSKSSIKATSKDSKSINSEAFWNDLLNTVKMQFTIKDNIYYTNHKGEKTPYKVVARDFYYTWLRTKLITQKERIANGGTKELDELANKQLCEPSSKTFTDNDSYGNEYLYKVFNLNSSDFSDESKFITKYNGEDAVTFDAKDKNANTKSQFRNFWDKCLFSNYDWMTVSSQYIDDMNEHPEKFKFYSYLNEEVSSDLKTKLGPGKTHTGKFWQTGGYWYGVSTMTTLFAGPYYAETYDATNYWRSYKKNSNYWDTEWVNADNNLKEIRMKYAKSSEIDKEQFYKNQFTFYKNGDVTSFPYSQLSDIQKAEILKDKARFGYRFTMDINEANANYIFNTQPLVKTPPKGTDLNNWFLFNDAYAKMLYGSTRQEIADGKQTLDAYVRGTGLSFRTILDAAVNWNFFEYLRKNGATKPWVAKLAEDGYVGGSEENTQTINDFYQRVNALSAYDKDGNLIKYIKNGNEFSAITPEMNADVTGTTDLEKMRSAGFDVLKQKLTELIAKFDTENPSLAGQDFTIETYFPWQNLDAKYKNALDTLATFYSQLNPRLKFKYTLYTQDKETQWKNFRYNGTAGIDFTGWGYDYNSSASGFDGLTSGVQLLQTLVSIKNANNATFDKNFPMLKKLAEAIFTYQTAHPVNSPVPFADLDKISNADSYGFLRYGFYEYTFEKNTTTGRYEMKYDVDGNPIPFANATDFSEFISLFWRDYISKEKNEDIIKLTTELSTYLNVDPYNNRIGVLNEKLTPSLLNKYYKMPTIFGYTTPYRDITIDKK